MKQIAMLLLMAFIIPSAHSGLDETAIKLDYWRAFDGGIEILIKLVLKPKVKSKYTSGKNWDDFEYSDSVEISIKEISNDKKEMSRRHLAPLAQISPLIDLSFEVAAQPNFRTRFRKYNSDGSSVSLLVSQNMVYTGMYGQSIFSNNEHEDNKKLVKLVKAILEVSGYDLQRIKLY